MKQKFFSKKYTSRHVLRHQIYKKHQNVNCLRVTKLLKSHLILKSYTIVTGYQKSAVLFQSINLNMFIIFVKSVKLPCELDKSDVSRAYLNQRQLRYHVKKKNVKNK